MPSISSASPEPVGGKRRFSSRQPATQMEAKANDMTELNANEAAGAADYSTGFGKPPLRASLRKGRSGNPPANGRPPKIGPCPCANGPSRISNSKRSKFLVLVSQRRGAPHTPQPVNPCKGGRGDARIRRKARKIRKNLPK